jgi:hypothetical protein
MCGRVVRVFNMRCHYIDPVQFNEPSYFVLDGKAHTIVADQLNERVIVLSSELQLKRILMMSLEGQPFRLCFIKDAGLLFVAYWYSTTVDAYRIQFPSSSSISVNRT